MQQPRIIAQSHNTVQVDVLDKVNYMVQGVTAPCYFAIFLSGTLPQQSGKFRALLFDVLRQWGVASQNT